MANPKITPENGGQPESVTLPPPHGVQLPLACHVTLLGNVAVRTDRLPLSEPPELDQPEPLKSSDVLIVPGEQGGECSIPAINVQRDGTIVSDGDWQTAFGRVGMVIGFHERVCRKRSFLKTMSKIQNLSVKFRSEEESQG